MKLAAMRKIVGLVHGQFVVLSILSCAACSRKSGEPTTASPPASAIAVNPKAQASAPAAVENTNPAASAPVAVPEVPPVCKVESKKVWVAGANKLTGLTDAQLPDGRIAIGLAVGNQPEVLLVAANAKGSLVKVPLTKGSRLASVPKGASRYMMRVTPVKVEGDTVNAFVDFEDRYQDKRRTLVCGPADSTDNWVEFDGLPFSARKNPKPEELAPLFHAEGAEKVYNEIASCRSFTNHERAETWILGSVLHGVLAADNSIKWHSNFVVSTGKGQPKIIESSEVKNNSLDDEHYEVPVSHALRNGSYLVAARHRGALLAGVLGPDKSLVGNWMHYTGYPTLPAMADDGGDALVMVTSFAMGKDEYGLRAMRVNEDKVELPKSLHVVVTDQNAGTGPSESDPDFARDAAGQRWIAHIEGERSNGQLALAPIDKNFHAVGRSFTVTESDEKATAARVVPLKDKGLLIVFLRDAGKALELITEEVHCKVEPYSKIDAGTR